MQQCLLSSKCKRGILRGQKWGAVGPIYESLGRQQQLAFKIAIAAPRTQLEKVVKDYYVEVWNSGNLDYLDVIMHPNVKVQDTLWQEDGFEGLKKVRKVFGEFLNAYPNQKYFIDDVIIDDSKNKAVVQWSSVSNNLGDYLGRPATGKRSEVTGVDIFYFTEEKLISQIEIYRQALAEEKAAYYEWDMY
eukprot:TRINITY_DN12748_c0_g1_i1.p1 TRINITY_DN12748_c0_g1~~TRINITY_DN12748_c0_g1_i1.p1  ORF type:complete len:205 (-),score=30.32 TRINITY_DN12748_c0_g1_i1:58-624(-)